VGLSDLRWPRRTARLELRPFTIADAEAVFAYRSLPEVGQWLSGLLTDVESLRARAADWQSAQLVMLHQGEVVGDLMLRIEDAWAQAEVAEHGRGVQAELGWVVAPWAQGRGFAREGIAELLVVAFDELGLRRVTANCFAANEASWRLMEAFGMRRELHAIAESLHRDDGWLDGYGYALLADEWRERRRPNAV